MLVGVANRGQRVEGRLVKECSSLLEGKVELDLEKALFSVALSASRVSAGEADMAVACVSKQLVYDGAVEYGV